MGEYEQLREIRMAENKAKLVSLGLDNAVANMNRLAATLGTKRKGTTADQKKKKKKKEVDIERKPRTHLIKLYSC